MPSSSISRGRTKFSNGFGLESLQKDHMSKNTINKGEIIIMCFMSHARNSKIIKLLIGPAGEKFGVGKKIVLWYAVVLRHPPFHCELHLGNLGE